MRDLPWDIIEGVAVLLFVVARIVRNGKPLDKITQKLREWGDKNE